MATVDANGYGVTIQVADGSYSAASAGSFCVSIIYRPRNALYFKIIGNTTTPANVEIDGVDQTPVGFSVGYNNDTSAYSPVTLDELSGFKVKNAYSCVSVTAWSSCRVTHFESQDNYVGFEAYRFSIISQIAYVLMSGGHNQLFSAGNAQINNTFDITFDVGSTLIETGFYLSPFTYCYTGGFDYTNLSDAGSAVKYFVDAYGYLDTGGTSASIPGSAGSADALGKVA